MSSKKLQQDSVWAKYDIDNDGTVSDEELERATQMIELDLREEKQDSQRRIAWVAMASMVAYSLLPLMPFVPEVVVAFKYQWSATVNPEEIPVRLAPLIAGSVLPPKFSAAILLKAINYHPFVFYFYNLILL